MNASTAKSKVARLSGIPYRFLTVRKSVLFEAYFVFREPFLGKEFYVVDDGTVRFFHDGKLETVS
uniref:Cyclic nucleotide-binding domain-containing protein n=1 Tax=Dulem virus 96 TaxID=3145807 RepID=A0AAU8B4B2_9VIRU